MAETGSLPQSPPTFHPHLQQATYHAQTGPTLPHMHAQAHALAHGFATHLPLRLAHIHVDELRPLDAHECGGALRGHRLGQQGLATACACAWVLP